MITKKVAAAKTPQAGNASSKCKMGFEHDVLNLTYKIAEMLKDEVKATGYEISWHPGHRPTHTFGGRQYTFEQMERQGINKMLQDYNCRHWKFPVMLGNTKPKYSAKELARLEAAEKVKYKWNGKEYALYELTQKMRQLEREVTMLEREIVAFGSLGNQARLSEEAERLGSKMTQYLELAVFMEKNKLKAENNNADGDSFAHYLALAIADFMDFFLQVVVRGVNTNTIFRTNLITRNFHGVGNIISTRHYNNNMSLVFRG